MANLDQYGVEHLISKIKNVISTSEVTYFNSKEITYNEIKELRDSGNLIPGQQYRITDYITTTSQENTVSAGHQFDIIVTANSNNILNEIASACLHEGDTYFSERDANLSAWQIWYCLDNDTSRFKWAMGYSYDSDNNLYEFDNWVTAVGKVCDDQIDTFYETGINEKFSHFNYTKNLDGERTLTLYGRKLNGDVDEGLDTVVSYHYSGVYKVDGKEYDGWAEFGKKGGIYGYAKDENGNPVYVLTERTAIGKGVIYRMIDEWGNDCPYDFKNIKFTKPIISETDTPDSKLYYTFCNYESNSSIIRDASIYGNNYTVYNNVIKPYYVNTKQSLNRILFIGNNCYWYSNTFGYDCFDNKFDIGCSKNTFGNRCYRNTFGNYCDGNEFGNVCYENKFDNLCSSNTFGSNCNNNTFGDNCANNTFGNSCCNNTFGDNCESNTFGNECISNTFGNECISNTFGNLCKVNEFGHKCNLNKFAEKCEENKLGKEATITISTNCEGNILGNYCRLNTFGVYCLVNILGNNCYQNVVGSNCNNNTFGNNCQSNRFGNYCEFNLFGEMCIENIFGNNCFNNTFGNNCFNNTFGEMSISSGTATIKSYYRNITFDDMCNSIYLNCEKPTSTSSYYQNVKVDFGVGDMSINDTNVNQTYLTIYKPKDVKTITV